jgi:hypothetical protein
MRYSILPLPAMILVALGCAGSTATNPAPAAASPDEQVKAAFATLQQALKERDADKIWDLLDKYSQQDADTFAAEWKKKLTGADPEEIKKKMGIGPDELAKLTGKTFLKTDAFYGKEIRDIASVKEVLDVKEGTVFYADEASKDQREHVKFVKQDGKWKAKLPMEQPR